jgi:hypothetical protein
MNQPIRTNEESVFANLAVLPLGEEIPMSCALRLRGNAKNKMEFLK